MARIPDMKGLNSRMLAAPAADEWLMGEMFPRMPSDAVFAIDAKLGNNSQPDDALMYLRLNVTRWRVDSFVALAWNEVLKMDLSSGRLPLLRGEDDSFIGVDTTVAKGERGHLARWKGENVTSLPFDTWESFYSDCVARLEAGAVARDPLRITAGMDVGERTDSPAT
ncbi:MAG TPA: hypothetical protein VFG14_07835 [Chthoniobacteraceae bacterium]|nr:hypothetical protein [Chthoniobacteraceae bacterium]